MKYAYYISILVTNVYLHGNSYSNYVQPSHVVQHCMQASYSLEMALCHRGYTPGCGYHSDDISDKWPGPV